MADVERELDRLYGLPLNEFTAARNQLARELKRGGDSQRAAEVAALKKPTVSAWVLNQLAREESPLVRRLLKACDELRVAQEQALGGGHADDLRRAVSAEREAVRELAQAARGVGDQGGETVGEPVLKRVRASLSAVAGNDEARDLLKRGRATADFERSGFPAFSRAAAPKPKPPRSGRRGDGDELAERRQRRAARQQHLQMLRQQLRQLKREATESRREAQRAERKAFQAQAEAERTRQEHREAVTHAAELAAEAERAEAELAKAEADARGLG